jgi:hypothetical protein
MFKKTIARFGLLALAASAGSVMTLGIPSASADSASFISSVAPMAQHDQAVHAVPASVSIAQAILESNWGNSTLAQNDKNYFGIKCATATNPGSGSTAIGCHAYPTTECTPTCHTVTAYFRVYAAIGDSFVDHGAFLRVNSRYANAFNDTNNPDQFVRDIAADGYATDPNYASSVISLMQTYNLYQYNTVALTSRIGVLQGGAVSVKEGALSAGWVSEYGGGVAKVVVDGDWIGVLTTGGQLYVKQGNLSAGWVPELGNVKDFSLAAGAGRVGVLRTDGSVAVKDGGLYGSWVEETGGVAELRLSGDWIGVVGTSGQVSVKAGPLNAGWLPEITGVADLQLDQAAGRVGVLRTDGSVAVKDGGLYGSWVEETNHVQQLQLTSY